MMNFSVLTLQFTLLLLVSFPLKTFAQPQLNNIIAQNSSLDQEKLAQADKLRIETKELTQWGKYQEAISITEKELAIRKKVLGDKHTKTLATVSNLGQLHYFQGDIPQAESLLKQLIDIKKDVLKQKNLDVAIILNGLAALSSIEDNYQQAQSFLQQALTIRQELLDESHLDTADSMNTLGLYFHILGKAKESESLVEKALDITKDLLGESHPQTIKIINSLGLLYTQQDNKHKEAEELLQKALSMRKKLLGESHSDTAESHNYLGNLYLSQGNYQEAEFHLKQALTIRQEVLGKDNIYTSNSLNDLATLYLNQGNYFKGESLIKEALRIREKVLGKNNLLTAISLNSLAMLSESQGEYYQAALLLTKVLNITKEVTGEKSPLTALYTFNLAYVMDSLEEFDKAELLYQKALSISEEVLGKHNSITIACLRYLAGIYWNQDNLSAALKYASEATEREEYNLTYFLQNIGDESRKKAYMKRLFLTTDGTVFLHLHTAPNNIQASRLALTNIIRRKGRVLDMLSNNIAILRQSESPQVQTLFDNLAQKRSELASLSYQTINNRTPNDYKKLINNLEEEIKQLETELSNKSVEFRTINQPITLDAVQKAIPQNTVLIEYIVYKIYNSETQIWEKPRYAAYVLHPNGDTQGVDLGDVKTINQLAYDFRSYASEYGYEDELVETSQQLYRLIFQPLLPLLKGKKTLLISPDSQLNLIPFAALQNQEKKYLIEDYSLSYLTSGRDLLKFQTQFPSKSNSVIVANPTYNLEESQIAIGNQDRGNSRRSGDLNLLQGCCEPLNGTKEEAEAIIPLLSQPQVFTRKDAMVENIIDIKAPKILHLATHGFFLPDLPEEEKNLEDLSSLNNNVALIPSENPLLRSGLALAGFNPQNQQMDGALTALDVTNLYLWGTKLVVLSACETGLGDVETGEGVYGLRRAFVLAGAESQLMSLWAVSDESTKELMINYYQRLTQGEGRAEALRQVQLEMINSKKYNHPFDWSAFIPSGDWRSIN